MHKEVLYPVPYHPSLPSIPPHVRSMVCICGKSSRLPYSGQDTGLGLPMHVPTSLQQLTCRAGAGTGASSQALMSSCTTMSAMCRLKPAEGSASLGLSTSSSRKLLYATVAAKSLHIVLFVHP